MGFFLGNCVGKRFGVDEIDVSADATQIAHGPGDGRLKRAVVPSVDVFFEIYVAIGMGELDNAPWRLEGAGGPRGHAGERGGDLRNRARFRQLAFQADVAAPPRPQEADETTADVSRKGASLGIDVNAPARARSGGPIGWRR